MEQTLGIVIGRQDALESRMSRHEAFMGDRIRGLELTLSGQDTKLDKIMATLSEQKGGVKLIVQLAGFAVAASAIVGAIPVIRALVWHA